MLLKDNVLYEFGTFRFDPLNRLLLEGDRRINLTPKAMEILSVLVQNGDRLTSKEELMRKVWPDSFVEDANLTVNISALRKLLGEAPGEIQYIETVPKGGYRFVAPIKETREEPPNLSAPLGLPASGSVDSANRQENGAQDAVGAGEPAPKHGRPSWLVFVCALVLVGIILFAFAVYRGPIPHNQVATFRQPRRLAVLPFQNLRDDVGDNFLGFSLADAVINKLGFVSALMVRPSYAVQRYKTQPNDFSKVARDLNVDTLLTGTFLHEGENLRIACQLVDVKTQNILWKGSFDLKYEKLLTVQDDVARKVVDGLELTLSPSEAERLRPGEPIDSAAYEYYLRGVDLYAKNDYPLAIKMLEKSTQLAPGYAPSWADLGKSYSANASFKFGGGEYYQKAQTAFERALSLQPDQINPRIYMANMFTDTGRVEKAVPLLRDALRTRPDNAETHWELGYAYRFAGMLQQSIAECERARQLDPGVKLNSSALNSYLYVGEYDRFLESLPNTDDNALIVFYRGFAEYHKKEWEKAARDFDQAFELDRFLLQAQIGKALSLGMLHQNARGEAILHGIEGRVNQFQVGDPEAVYKIAQGYAVLGDKPAALRVLRSSIEKGFFPYPYFIADPLLDTVRGEPQFAELMNLAAKRHAAFKQQFFQ
jgi:DNA-binding winged helix-turn-helix (wHTH) protein/TolB-like protein/tetratricopeptide (TPR) repeat protein